MKTATTGLKTWVFQPTYWLLLIFIFTSDILLTWSISCYNQKLVQCNTWQKEQNITVWVLSIYNLSTVLFLQWYYNRIQLHQASHTAPVPSYFVLLIIRGKNAYRMWNDKKCGKSLWRQTCFNTSSIKGIICYKGKTYPKFIIMNSYIMIV